MEQDYDNPFSAFSDIQIDIDNGATEDELALLQMSDDDEFTDTTSSLTVTTPHSEILAVRPNDRQEVATMSQEAIHTELSAYEMPEASLSSLSEDTQARLLESFRKKQDITEYQTIGAMQVQGQILPPKLLAVSNKLSEYGVVTDLLTPEEVVKVKRFTEYRPEDTDDKLQIILDIITESKNGVHSRRDYADLDTVYYNQEKAEKLEDVTDKINDYLRNGGYANHEYDPEYVSKEERENLMDEYGDDPAFTHCTRTELIELGYLDEGDTTVLGPLDDKDLSFINSVTSPSYSPKVSNRSFRPTANYDSAIKRYYSHSDRSSDLETNMLGKYIEEEVANKRTLEPKSLVCAFAAFEKEFFESGFTEKVKEYLEQNPNESIEKTLQAIRKKLMYGGRYCNLLVGGSDTEARKKYKTMISTSSEFMNEIIKKAESWTDDYAARKLETQSGFIVKLDSTFDEIRVAYSALNAVIEAQPSTNSESRENAPKGITNQSVHRALEAKGRAIYDEQFTNEVDIRMPDNSEN